MCGRPALFLYPLLVKKKDQEMEEMYARPSDKDVFSIPPIVVKKEEKSERNNFRDDGSEEMPVKQLNNTVQNC